MVTVAKAVFGFFFFPFLVPVAFVHSIIFGLVMVVKNVKPIFGKIISFVYCLLGIASFLLFGTTIARQTNNELKDTPEKNMGTGFLAFYLAVLALFNVLCATTRDESGGYTGVSWWWNNKWIFLGIVATNVLSIFYKIGRWYWNSVLKKKFERSVPKQPEVEEVKQEEPAPVKAEVKPTPKQDDDDEDLFENFTRLLGQIEAILNSDSFEETIKAFLEEIEKLFKEGGLTSNQACHLKKLIDNAKANKAGLAKV